ncbi:MAG: hypothetical protein ACKVU4_01260 [Phycisphaerales bacterium]
MQRTPRIVSLGVIALLNGTAFAGIKTFTAASSGGTTGNWNVAGDWSPNGVPTEADRVVIPTGKHCKVNIDTAVADTVEVQTTGDTNGVLQILGDQKLTLDNDNDNIGATDPDDSIINGTFIVGDSSTGGTLVFAENIHTVSGGGTIAGLKQSTIQIAATRTLTNKLADTGKGIRGELVIEGLTGSPNGQFVNHGLVETSGGLLTLASTTILSDNEDAVWSLRCGGVMRFDREALDLLGDFTGYSTNDVGSFTFNQSVVTCGTYTRNDGGIVVAANKTFTYRYFAGGTMSCTNPGSAVDANGLGGINNDLIWRVSQVSSTSRLNCD